MKKVTIEVFSFDELSDDAKKVALQELSLHFFGTDYFETEEEKILFLRTRDFRKSGFQMVYDECKASENGNG